MSRVIEYYWETSRFREVAASLAKDFALPMSRVLKLEDEVVRKAPGFIDDCGKLLWDDYTILWRAACYWHSEHLNRPGRDSQVIESYYRREDQKHAIEWAAESCPDDRKRLIAAYELGMKCAVEAKLELNGQIDKYLPGSDVFASYFYRRHPEADYMVALKRVGRYKVEILATCGWRYTSQPNVAIIENLQGNKYADSLPKLKGWRHLLVAAAEQAAREHGTEVMLFRPAETHRYKDQARMFGVNLEARMNWTARQMHYRKTTDSRGLKVYVKPLLDGAVLPSDCFVPDFRPGDEYITH